MFQQQCEMGLFTFYYEATHSDRKREQPSRRSDFVDHEGTARRGGAEMEEKGRSKHRTEKHQSQVIKNHSHLYFQLDKQTKNLLVPHTVNLVPSLAHHQIKSGRDQDKPKHFKEHSPEKIEEDEVKETEEGLNAVEKLLFCDEIECHKKTLEIAENVTLGKGSCPSSLRTLKARKQTIKQQSSLVSFQKFPSLNIQSDCLPAHSCRLPLLLGVPKHSQKKKMKRMKENYLLQKICLAKETQSHNSVVNIGVDSTDDYKLRWRKRKEEFLTLLSRNLQVRQ